MTGAAKILDGLMLELVTLSTLGLTGEEVFLKLMEIIERGIAKLPPGSQEAVLLAKFREAGRGGYEAGLADTAEQAEEALNSDDPSARFVRSLFAQVDRKREWN